jgi:hypothetical protein
MHEFTGPFVAFVVALLVAAAPCRADPWAGPGDLALRHDIQLLADAGVLAAPVNAWPIPWAALAVDLDAAADGLAPEVMAAYARVQARLEQVRGLYGPQPNARLALRTSPFWLRNFEDTPREESEVRAGASMMTNRFAGRAQVSFAADPLPGDREWRIDGSYLAAVLGNHIVYAGAVDRWWGPGHDDTLVLSSNARPVTGFGMQRRVAVPPGFDWLSWVGPWSYSFLWGFLESERAVPDARLMAFRLGFRPTHDLEIGLVRTAQWCGQGRPCSAGTAWDLIVGDSNIDDRDLAADNDPGNQLAAIDVRWQSPFTDGPWALYAQGVAEDEAGGLPSRYFYQFGLETWGGMDSRLYSGSWRAHLEYTNTLVHFWTNAPLYQVAYEHPIYESGYRYRGRALGAAADRDSQLVSLGLTLVDARARSWNGLLRFAEINRQGDGTGVHARHTVSPEELRFYGAQLSHRRAFGYDGLDLGTISLGLGLQFSDNRVTGESDTDLHAFLQWAWDYSRL